VSYFAGYEKALQVAISICIIVAIVLLFVSIYNVRHRARGGGELSPYLLRILRRRTNEGTRQSPQGDVPPPYDDVITEDLKELPSYDDVIAGKEGVVNHGFQLEEDDQWNPSSLSDPEPKPAVNTTQIAMKDLGSSVDNDNGNQSDVVIEISAMAAPESNNLDSGTMTEKMYEELSSKSDEAIHLSEASQVNECYENKTDYEIKGVKISETEARGELDEISIVNERARRKNDFAHQDYAKTRGPEKQEVSLPKIRSSEVHSTCISELGDPSTGAIPKTRFNKIKAKARDKSKRSEDEITPEIKPSKNSRNNSQQCEGSEQYDFNASEASKPKNAQVNEFCAHHSAFESSDDDAIAPNEWVRRERSEHTDTVMQENSSNRVKMPPEETLGRETKLHE
ncbi:uncharacterized protein LOC108676539, partial [Hyalella azteca]|uniref:Uncharacterized protein LOC108676539 n=1 Tax=Hyalella azteca TaxID=294128 RepID=A0A8B7P267_HYAAZ